MEASLAALAQPATGPQSHLPRASRTGSRWAVSIGTTPIDVETFN